MFHFDVLTKIKKWLTTSKTETESGKYFADAKSVKDLNDKFGGMSFGVNSSGQYGYKKAGTDTVIPFKQGIVSSISAVIQNVGIGDGVSFSANSGYYYVVCRVVRSGEVTVFSTITNGSLIGQISVRDSDPRTVAGLIRSNVNGTVTVKWTTQAGFVGVFRLNIS